MLPPLGFQSKEPAVNEWGRRSGSIVNTNGQECQDAGTRLAKYEALVTEQRTRSTGSSTIVQRESRHQTQLVLVCWKRTHICSNSDGGWDRSLLAPDMDHTLTTTCEIATFSVTFSILSFLKLLLQCLKSMVMMMKTMTMKGGDAQNKADSLYQSFWPT